MLETEKETSLKALLKLAEKNKLIQADSSQCVRC